MATLFTFKLKLWRWYAHMQQKERKPTTLQDSGTYFVHENDSGVDGALQNAQLREPCQNHLLIPQARVCIRQAVHEARVQLNVGNRDQVRICAHTCVRPRSYFISLEWSWFIIVGENNSCLTFGTQVTSAWCRYTSARLLKRMQLLRGRLHAIT
jgi:hypothetical protein